MNTRTAPETLAANYNGAIVNGAINRNGMETRKGATIIAENQITEYASAVRSGDARGFFLLKIASHFFPAHTPMRNLLDAIHGLNVTPCADAEALEPYGNNLIDAAFEVTDLYGVEVLR